MWTDLEKRLMDEMKRGLDHLEARIVKLEAYMAVMRKDEWRRHKYGIRRD